MNHNQNAAKNTITVEGWASGGSAGLVGQRKLTARLLQSTHASLQRCVIQQL